MKETPSDRSDGVSLLTTEPPEWLSPSTTRSGGSLVGSCAGDLEAAIRIAGLGVFKVYHLVTSPDGSGDGVIGLTDLGTFQHAFVTQSNPQYGDLNLDEEIGLRDLGFFQHHFTAP